MAALVLRPPHALDLGQLYAYVSEHLPRYAWPRFLRLQVTIHSCCDLSPHICTPSLCSSRWLPNPTKGHPITHSEEEEQLLPDMLLTPSYLDLAPSLSLHPLNPDLMTPFSQTCPLIKFRQLT